MKGTRFTKLVSLLLSVLMIVTMLPASALAETTGEPSDGQEITTGGSEDPVQYTVTFVADGKTVDTQVIEEGGSASKPDDPAPPEGMEFQYWYFKNQNKAYDFSAAVTADIQLTALFTEAAEPKLAAAAEGGIIPDDTPLRTYTFYVDGAQWGDQQVIATGDTLNEPAIPPAEDGMRFAGWFDGNDVRFTSFGVQTVEATGSVDLTAKFEAAYYVFFYNKTGTAIIETRTPDENNQVPTTDVASLELATDEALAGWSLTMGGTTDVGDAVTVDGANIRLYPIVKNVIWISFESNGGSYITPVHINPDTALNQNDFTQEPTRVGYVFAGWTPEGIDWGDVPSANVTLSASWTANANTPYKLVYWIENANDSGYTFEKLTAKTGTSGAAVSVGGQELSTQNLDPDYRNYFNTGTYTPGQTIGGDGSTIVNIYFTRKTFTLTFRNGYQTLYSGTHKYDEDISEVWEEPAIKNLSDDGYNWKSSITGYYYAFLEKMPGSDLTMRAEQWSGTLYVWYYYLETLDGTAATAPAGSETVVSNGITYYKARTASTRSYGLYLTYDEDYYPITGFVQRDSDVPDFTYHRKKGGQEAYYDASLFYLRSDYDLTFINGASSNTVADIRYEAEIEGYNYEPARPSGIDENFQFGGWYTTEGCFDGSEFTWTGASMPAHNIVLYAKWAAPAFSGIAHLSVYGSGGTEVYDLGTIVYGGTISSSALSAAQEAAEAYKPNEEDVFGGWHIMLNGSLILFNAEMQIYSDVSLYPHWISGVSYAVTYNLGLASGTAPVDSGAYGAGAKAQVLAYDASAVTPPEGKSFIGWLSDSDGNLHYPNSAITIDGDIELTAIWSSATTYVDIVYDGNGGELPGGGTDYSVPVPNNTHHTIQTNSFELANKAFSHWNTKSDGSGTSYNEGDSVLVGTSALETPSTLYAIWGTAYYTVSVTVNPPEGANVTSGVGTYPANTNVHLVQWALTEGYEIVSVFDNGVQVLPEQTYAGNKLQLHKLDADHEIVINLARSSRMLTYNGNGGTYSGGTEQSIQTNVGDSYIVPENFFNYEGRYFLGWSTDSGAAAPDAAYAPGTQHNMPDADVVIYAVWAEKTALTITANSDLNKIYNGNPQSVSGFTGDVSGLTYEGTTAGVTATDAGTYTAAFSNQAGLIIRQNGTDVTDRYTVTWVEGAMVIAKKSVTVTADDRSMTYGDADATPAEGVSYSGFVNGETSSVVSGTDSITYTYEDASDNTVTVGSALAAGTYSITPGVGGLSAANYTFTAADGTLEVTNATFSISLTGGSWTYNGTSRSATLSGTQSGDTIVYRTSTDGSTWSTWSTDVPSVTHVDDGPLQVEVRVSRDNYDDAGAGATLTITPREIELTAQDKSWTYDGSEHMWHYYDITSGSFVGTEGVESAAFSAASVITDTGTVANTITGVTLNDDTQANDYSFTYEPGTLEVTNATFSISLTGGTWTYDGSAYSAELDGTQSGDTIVYRTSTDGSTWSTWSTDVPSVTHVDDGPLQVEVKVSRANYTDATDTATLTITAQAIELTADDKSWTFDGDEHYWHEYTITSGSFVTGEGIDSVTFSAASVITNTGTVANTITGVTLNDDTQANDYSFTYESGTLEVTNATFHISLTGATWTYNGTSRSATLSGTQSGDTIEYRYLADGDTAWSAWGAAVPSVTHVDDGPMQVEVRVSRDNYDDAGAGATLTITAREIELTAQDKSWTYDGSEHTWHYYDITSGSFVGTEGVENAAFSAASVITDTGTVANTITGVTLNDDTQANDYSFTYESGTLEVTNATFSISLTGGSWTYNGTSRSATLSGTQSGDTIEYFTLLGTDWIPFAGTPSVKDVSDGPLQVKAIVSRANYNDAEATATLSVSPATLTVTAGDKEITYPANRPVEASLTYSATAGLASGETVGYTGVLAYASSLATQPPAGTYSDVIEQGTLALADNAGGSFKAGNYTMSFVEGDLTVRKGTMTVSAQDVTEAYDGGLHMVSPLPSVVNGTMLYFSLIDSTDPNDYTMTVPSLVNVPDSATVYFMAQNDNYNNAFGHADVTIMAVDLTVTADDRSMTYGDADATPAEGVSYSGFVNGETSGVVSGTGSITYTYKDASDNAVTVGSTLAAGTYSITPGVSGLSATNYTFAAADGELTVNQAGMTVSSPGYDEPYDGGAHGLTASAPGVPGAQITYSSTENGVYTATCPTFTDAGEYTVYFKAVDPDGNHSDASGSAKVIIRKVEITVTADDRSMTYGDADATPTEGVSYSGFVSGETSGVVSGTGSITYTYKDASDNAVTVGSTLAAGTYSITPGVSGLSATNYTFAAADGELTVNPRPVRLVADDSEKNTGIADPAFTYHFETGLIGGTAYYDVLAQDAAAFSFDVTRTDAPDEAVGVHAGVLTPGYTADAAALANYAFTTVNADFTVHPMVSYLPNTQDVVTGFPNAEWFDYLSDAAIADATGIVRTGYDLTGWTDLISNAVFAPGEIIPAIDRNLYLAANWALATYDVTYETGTVAAVGNMPADLTDVAYTATVTVSGQTPTRAGFTFAHWTTTGVTGAAANYDGGDTFEMPANAVVLTAVWTPNITPVFYHANGGEGGAYEEGRYETGSVVTVAGNTFTRPGFRFIGWSTTANGAVAQQPGNTFVMGALQVNYYAQWEQQFYTVTYIVTGGTGEGLDGGTPYANYTGLAYGDAVPAPNDPALDGYTFDGWTTAIPATVPEGDITIYGTMSVLAQPTEPPEIIPEEQTPLAGPAWALLNLILAIATALASVLMLLGLIGKKKEDVLDGGIVRETKKHATMRILTLLPAVGGIVAFILTENMKNPMTFVDRWTILMAVIALIQLGLVFFGIKRDKDVEPSVE
jgi:uncharacterized repeat protein (TIGR02543 family)